MEKTFTKPLHALRNNEIEIIKDLFLKCDNKSILELGCGDGFQSKLLKNYFHKIISTDLNENRMNFELANQGITLKVLDAELVGENYPKESFDFVFSSNMLEHIPDYNKCLKGIKHILKNDGIAIIILPNTLWRLSGIIFHYPYKLRNLYFKILGKRKSKNESIGNNIKTSKKAHITKENISEIMLSQIPNVSINTAKCILSHYNNIENLIKILRENNECLENIKVKSKNSERKIAKNAIENIKMYLL